MAEELGESEITKRIDMIVDEFLLDTFVNLKGDLLIVGGHPIVEELQDTIAYHCEYCNNSLRTNSVCKEEGILVRQHAQHLYSTVITSSCIQPCPPAILPIAETSSSIKYSHQVHPFPTPPTHTINYIS